MTNNSELEKEIKERVKVALTETKSDDPVVHLAWLAKGIDLWHRSNKKSGHSPENAMKHIISSATRLIHTETQRAVEEHIKPYLDECEAQNGIRHCKNCGLEPINHKEKKS